MEKQDEYQELTTYLEEQGHSADEIGRILKRVRRYEREMRLDSVMDSIGDGSFNLKALIEEVLDENENE